MQQVFLFLKTTALNIVLVGHILLFGSSSLLSVPGRASLKGQHLTYSKLGSKVRTFEPSNDIFNTIDLLLLNTILVGTLFSQLCILKHFKKKSSKNIENFSIFRHFFEKCLKKSRILENFENSRFFRRFSKIFGISIFFQNFKISHFFNFFLDFQKIPNFSIFKNFGIFDFLGRHSMKVDDFFRPQIFRPQIFEI